MRTPYAQPFGQTSSKAAQCPAERLAIIIDVLYFDAHGPSPRRLIGWEERNPMAQQPLRQQSMPCPALHAPAFSVLLCTMSTIAFERSSRARLRPAAVGRYKCRGGLPA